jgi:hypothetical protein
MADTPLHARCAHLALAQRSKQTRSGSWAVGFPQPGMEVQDSEAPFTEHSVKGAFFFEWQSRSQVQDLNVNPFNKRLAASS